MLKICWKSFEKMLIYKRCGCEVRPPQIGGKHTCACAPKSGRAMWVRATQNRVATHTLPERNWENFFNSRYFGLRLALADKEMQRETVPLLKPTVWVRPDSRTGAPGYVRMDKRRKRSFALVRQQYRALVPLDKRVNNLCAPFSSRKIMNIRW